MQKWEMYRNLNPENKWQLNLFFHISQKPCPAFIFPAKPIIAQLDWCVSTRLRVCSVKAGDACYCLRNETGLRAAVI